MSAPGSPTGLVAHALVDRAGLLLAADPALASLNARAGGDIGAAVAVPQLATVARLARRLDIPVSRGVTVADEDADLELWVRAEPDGDAVRLAVSGWRETPAWRPATAVGSGMDAAFRWEADPSARLTFVTLEGAMAVGLDAAGLLGQPLTSLLVPEDAGPLADALAGRRAFSDRPARLRGSGRGVWLSAVVHRDGAGAFIGWRGTVRLADTAPAPTEPALPATFTGGLDRALRAPLTRIVANADSMSAAADGPIPPAYADYAADIAGAGRHLLALIDDLVDLQAIERPDFALAVERIDLADVARRAAGLLGVRASERGVTVERPNAGVAVSASGDFRRALQVVVNLLGNAIRYSPPGGTVMLAARVEGARALVTVVDEGPGIAPADQARIFEKFGRVDPGEEGGNGLGLYIARRLARAMGGDLTVESAPGAGARFTLALGPAPDGRA